ncbi:Kappa-B-binding protein-like nuclear factor [Rhynchospora pubera]|uniref:Kappa-B-binding protein-like nuclear factor n=1 Tax=Rhynchospora pubera TaxID=906938 RepID=A0AAV8DC33_9POAL|nr:Kappa-B-binding protein-like nuclear factor [Rhynchospora pubera]
MAILQSNGEAPVENGDASHGSESDDVGPPLILSSSDSSDIDSGMESDEPDITSFLEPGSELCQIGNQTIALPVELYELQNLGEILSIDTWNNVLSDSDRLELAKYLPDMDQETFTQTLAELFGGKNFNFESPMRDFFERLRGGECDPRAVLSRKGMDFAQKRGYYYNLCRYHNSMVGRISGIKEAWQNCEGYGLEEKMRLLHIIRSQEPLGNESDQNIDLESEPEESQSESQSQSESELQNSDSDDNMGRDYLNGSFRDNTDSFNARTANGFPKKRNQKVGFARNEKFAMRHRQLRCDEERDDREVCAVPQKFRGKIKDGPKLAKVKLNNKAKNNLDLGARRLKRKGADKKSWNDDDNNKSLMAEVNGSPERYEDAESDLSPKGAVVEPVFDKDKPKKKLNSKKKTLSKEVKAGPIEDDIGHTKGRKVGKKRKSVVDPSISEKENTELVLNSANIVPKIEVNGEKLVDAQLVDVPVLQDMETPTKKQKKKTPSPNGEKSMKKRKHEKLDSGTVESNTTPQSDNVTASKKRGRKKMEPTTDAGAAAPIEPVKQEEVAPVTEPVKPPKKAYIPITPTVHTGFSFSIVHLLSAIRKAMMKVGVKDNALPVQDNIETETVQSEELAGMQVPSFPSLTLLEIAERVRLDPLDTSILKAPEPLNELIRGALRIFSSKHAPLGAKAWKPLVSCISSNKSWSWVGPVIRPTDDMTADEETSSDMWGVPQKSLVKLVDSFADWLKKGEEILKRISSLPHPPVPIHANLQEKDRFKEIKSLKSQNTICPCSDEVRSYYRMEEAIRYSIPDRAFMYTATDGRKSTVAPLGRGGGKKPSTKARDHFMLKPDRPPHVTILGLVRDAAARLPGSIGTRADVCTLIRDSQFIVDDVADEKVSEVVSGALDRLHYEQDPCVKFDSERKLWVYLHREREEEDFEDEGTSSTKKWKKPKKEAPESTQIEAVKNGETSNVNNGMLEVEGSYVDANVSEVTRPFGDLNLLYGDNPFVCQPGQANPFAAQPGQENPFAGRPGQENPFVAQPGQENPFGSQPGQGNLFAGQPGQGNLFAGQPGQGNPFSGQPGQRNPFAGQPDQENPFAGQENPFSGQPGQENPFAGQPGQENPFAGQSGQNYPFVCQPGQENPYVCHPGQTDPFTSQAGSSNGVLAEPFVEDRQLGFFDTTLL